MATKDWKKTINKKIYIAYSKKDKHIIIQKTGLVKKWDVYTKTHSYSTPIIQKHNIPKTQALKFAKDYMRKH
tara:strand:- start:40 stop:255 length:216 start_codon:yes stop_codon:yes gene_type:complete